MGDAHVSRQVGNPLAILKHLGCHAIALALEYPAAGAACRNATGVLTSVLEVVEALVQVDSGFDARRVGEDETENAAHLFAFFLSARTREREISNPGIRRQRPNGGSGGLIGIERGSDTDLFFGGGVGVGGYRCRTGMEFDKGDRLWSAEVGLDRFFSLDRAQLVLLRYSTY